MQDSTEILKTLNSVINTPLSMAINCPELREQISKFKQCSLNTPLSKAINSPELREQISKLAESQLLRPNNPMLIFQQMIKAPNERSVIVNPISKPMPLLLEGETPSPKAKAQGKVNERGAYKDEADITEALGEFEKAVKLICLKIKSLPNNQIPTIAKIKTDALDNCGLSERQVTRYVKIMKTRLLPETTTEHIRQIVRQFFKGNSLILRKLKVNV